MGAAIPQAQDVLAASVHVPDHVVHRDFEGETVALNLRTGTYHGLNPSAAQMLEVLAAAGTVAEAVPGLTATFRQPGEVIERDVIALCRALAERGLIELDHGDAG